MAQALDKATILARFGCKSGVYTSEDGDTTPIRALTLPQRERMQEIAKGSTAKGLVEIVCMGCDLFDDSDGDIVEGLEPEYVLAVSNAILELSGLTGEPEKN